MDHWEKRRQRFEDHQKELTYEQKQFVYSSSKTLALTREFREIRDELTRLENAEKRQNRIQELKQNASMIEEQLKTKKRYSKEEIEKVLRQLWYTLSAAVDFFTNLTIEDLEYFVFGTGDEEDDELVYLILLQSKIEDMFKAEENENGEKEFLSKAEYPPPGWPLKE